jgi:MOSC domain-containing protein YiiM
VQKGTVLSVQVGQIAPLGPDGVPSGFVKRPVTTAVRLTPLGLEGDAQADLRVHGGPDKAVYCYPVEHYERWRALAPAQQELVPGAFGENLTVQGFGDERAICLGDIVAIGDARLQVTQPRMPCFKLALRFDDRRMGRIMMQTGMTGWYYRVLEPALVRASADIILVERPNPDCTIAQMVQRILRRDMSN